MVHEVLESIRVGDEELTLHVVSDDHPLSAKAVPLWSAVYCREFGYLREDKHGTLSQRDRGALLILALRGDECVGTLRMAYQRRTPSDFEFVECPEDVAGPLGALSRLVVAREFRKSALSLHLLSQCHRFNRRSSHAERYENILVTCAPELLHFYRAFGFELLRDELLSSHTFRDELFLVGCDAGTNARIVAMVDRVLAGDWLAKAWMAARYHFYKLRALSDARVRAARARPRAKREEHTKSSQRLATEPSLRATSAER